MEGIYVSYEELCLLLQVDQPLLSEICLCMGEDWIECWISSRCKGRYFGHTSLNPNRGQLRRCYVR